MTWRDLAARIDRAAARPFETSVTYTHDPGGTPVPIAGIQGVFDAAGTRVTVAGGVEVLTTQPMVGLHIDDLATAPNAPARGDTVLIDGFAWSVEAWEQDGPAVGLTVWLIDPS